MALPLGSSQSLTLHRGSCIVGALGLFLSSPGQAEAQLCRPKHRDLPVVEHASRRVSEGYDAADADRVDTAGRGFSVSPYIRGGTFGGYDRLANHVFPSDSPPEVETATQGLVGAGAIIDRGCRFTFDLGAFSTSAELEHEGLLESEPLPIPIRIAASPEVMGLRAAIRYHPLRTDRASPWISLGGRGMRIRSAEVEHRAFGELAGVFRSEEKDLLDLTVGAGLNWSVSRRFALSFDADYGIGDTGWSAGFGISLRPNVPRCEPIDPPRIFTLDLDVDTNRNGVIEDSADEPNEDKFLGSTSGAIVIANLDDDDGDCDEDYKRNQALQPVREQGPCPPDSGDDEIDGDLDRLDMAPVVIRIRPGAQFFGARYSLRIEERLANNWVQVFHEDRVVLGPDQGTSSGTYKEWIIPSPLLDRQEIPLLVEARYYATGEFDGLIKLEVISRSFLRTSILDTVILKVAPWIMAHHLQPTEEVWLGPHSTQESWKDVELSASGCTDNNPCKNKTSCCITKHLHTILTNRQLATMAAADAQWAQDSQEIGYSVAPGHNGADVTAMHAALVSPDGFSDKPLRPRPQFGSLSLCTPDVAPDRPCGWIGGKHTIDGFGNLEVTPPLEGWPLGRIYYGGRSQQPGETQNPKQPAMARRLQEFFHAQQVQGPVEIDTTWLAVGHVDEILSFIPHPHGGQNAFKILIASPETSYRLLFQAPLPNFTCAASVNQRACDQARQNFFFNVVAQHHIYEARSRLTQELRLTDPDIFIEVPVIFKEIPSGLTAETPNFVNLLVASGDLIIPATNITAFREDLEHKLTAIGYAGQSGDPTFHFIDTSKYGAGEIHCLTNTVRQMPHESRPDQLWWSLID